MSSFLKNIIRFVLFIFFQVFILDYIPPLHQFIVPYLYFLYILWLPFNINRVWLMVISFVFGLTLDSFTGTYGLHAAPCVLIASVIAIDAGADAIIVSGGVSVGPYDVVRLAFERLAGSVSLWRVAVQPGKPFAFARVAGGSRPVLLFGLPGNPVSSFVTFELFVRPALRRLAGHRDVLRPRDRAVLEEPVSKSAGRRGFQRVMALRDGDGGPERDAAGRVRVRLAGGQGSHVMSALAAADALAVVPESVDRLPAGAEVELRWLDRG